MNSTIKTQQNSLNNTLYNLQSKRTLPRDVIKWMQGLDLSYSVKDYRKDLSNGFLIAEIISRYEPGKIPMHAFQNSHNQARVENNWGQLGLFFTKNELRRVKIEEAEFAKIKMGNDTKSEQLYEFICRLYTVCTKRNLPEGNQVTEIPMNETRNPNLTASYLLKDDGLEKLENSQISQISQPEPEKSHEDRVPTRKISPQLDAPARVDVKGIGIKQEANRKMTSKKKSWEAKSESFYEESNPYVEKYVFDYLNEILEECLNNEEAISSETRDSFQNSELKFTETFAKGMPWESKLFLDFLSSVKSSVNEILSVMLKDLNEIWKFWNYFVQFIGYYSESSEEFDLILDVLITFAIGGNLVDKRKMNKVFMESIIDSLISEVKGSTEWKKRGRIMEIVYDFSGREIEDKKAVLFTLKEKLGSSNPLYFGWLTELVKEEKNKGGDSKLVEDFIYYANQQISSSNPNLRLSSLKILYTVASNGWISLIESFLSQEANLRKFKYVSDFEAIYLISSIYLMLLKQIVENNEYQTLAKGKNQGNSNAIKVYNPDHEKQANEIKQKVHNISMVIAQLYHNSSSFICREVIAKQSVTLMGESAPLLLVVVFHLSTLKELNSFLDQNSFLLELKTTQALVEPIKIEILEENVNEMMGELIRLREEKRSASIPENADLSLEINQQLALMNFCLKHINIKKLNIELWENIGDRFCKEIAGILCNSEFSSLAWDILQKIYAIIFNYDMKMPNLNIWVAESICEGLKTQGESFDMPTKISDFFKSQYENANIEEVRSSADEINEILEENGFNKLIDVQRS